MTNPPQPQADEFQKDSSLDADRGYDKSKLKNEGVPVDSALTGVPIAMVGKDPSIAEKVAAFIRPDWETVYTTNSIEELLSRLPDLPEPKPVAVVIGGGFGPEEQDDLEKRAPKGVKVIKSRPNATGIDEKLQDLPIEDRAPRVVKALLDSRRAEFVKITDTAAAVTKNAV